MSWVLYVFYTKYLLTVASYYAGRRPPCSSCAPEWLCLISDVAPWSTDLCIYIDSAGLWGALIFLLVVATLCRMLLAQVRPNPRSAALPFLLMQYLLWVGLPGSILVCTIFLFRLIFAADVDRSSGLDIGLCYKSWMSWKMGSMILSRFRIVFG
jgi:hypothetical protein